MPRCWGWIFIRSKNKHSENNSDNRNSLGDRKKAEKYYFLAVEKVSEKIKHPPHVLINMDMNIKHSSLPAKRYLGYISPLLTLSNVLTYLRTETK